MGEQKGSESHGLSFGLWRFDVDFGSTQEIVQMVWDLVILAAISGICLDFLQGLRNADDLSMGDRAAYRRLLERGLPLRFWNLAFMLKLFECA